MKQPIGPGMLRYDNYAKDFDGAAFYCFAIVGRRKCRECQTTYSNSVIYYIKL